MKKRLAIMVSLVIVPFIFATFAIGAEFWASKNSNEYHYPTCKWAQKINPSNLAKFKSSENPAAHRD